MSRSESAEPTGRHVKRKHGLTRSKNGCLTCRRRRKKCDGVTPHCSLCARLQLDCEWPDMSKLIERTSDQQSRTEKRLDVMHRSLDDGTPHFLGRASSLVRHRVLLDSRHSELSNTVQALSSHEYNGIVKHFKDLDHSNGTDTLDLDGTIRSAVSLLTPKNSSVVQWLSATGNCSPPPSNSNVTCNKESFSITRDVSSPLSQVEDNRHSVAKEVSSSCGSLGQIGQCSPRWSLTDPTDHDTRILLDYFETEFAHLISVAPMAHNDILQVLMPMASYCDGIRNALAGWSATHLRDIDDKFTAQSQLYMKRAMDALHSAMFDSSRCDQDTTLALASIICAVEVCKDSDSQWVKYLRIAHGIITRRNLVHTYHNRDQVFLLKNFAYIDVMSSFDADKDDGPVPETHEILSAVPNTNGPDCYMGIATSIYSFVSETTTLAIKMRKEQWDERRIATHACRLIVMIDHTEPKDRELSELPDAQAVTKHLTMFKILQLTAKLYINQVLLRYPATSISSQVLIHNVMPLFNTLQTILVEMLFPLFIVGVDSLVENRGKVKRMLEILDERFRIGNVRCAYTVLERCWEINAGGEEYVDWNAVALGMFGQRINLA